MASNDSDVSKSLPSISATPSTSAGLSASSSHRSCPRCARRMSSLKFDKHSVSSVGTNNVLLRLDVLNVNRGLWTSC